MCDDDKFDTDSEHMSLAVMVKLFSTVSQLKWFLALWQSFDEKLGDQVSGIRHRGFLMLITSTVAELKLHVDQLADLRDEKQRGNMEPGQLEETAIDIYETFDQNKESLDALMAENVDMCDKDKKGEWLQRKDDLLLRIMAYMTDRIEQLDEHGGKEIEDMTAAWVTRWETYAKLPQQTLKEIGYISTVNKDHTCG